MKFSTLRTKFPIYSENLKISPLSNKYIAQYMNELAQDYYLEYLDDKKILTMKKKDIQEGLSRLVKEYHSNNEFIYEYRLIATYHGILAGGLTLFPINNTTKSIEIAYWIQLHMQKHGFGYEILNNIVKFIFDTFKNVDSIVVNIQEQNIASIKLAEKVGFRLVNKGQSTYGTYRVYMISRG